MGVDDASHIVCHPKMHVCAQYVLRSSNYVVFKAIAHLISFENHRTLFVVAQFCEGFFVKCPVVHVYRHYTLVGHIN